MQLGSEFSGLSASRYNQLRRQGAPRIIQDQVLGELAKRRGGALEQGLIGIEGLSEEARRSALAQLSNIYSQLGSETGQGFGQLFGAGFTSLLNQLSGNKGYSSTDEELNRLIHKYD